MVLRNVEGHEIVPGVLYLWSLGNVESQPPHNVLEVLDGLRNGVQLTKDWANTRQRGINALFVGRFLHRGTTETFRRGIERGLNCVSHLIESLACGGAML